eukprot:CAMPEP_0194333746 /NCGR_PEP_ID=MMETSP0171-20130528/63854_1 /TAXON_ID=218684 /ORGANISM="Corethron pennatum, Strain L29A3" /LENGTH=237 /DNA_ID=CAMNT_0039096113 /DNA_START=147 /DNA_END=857 /DNA_ORIENTATION=+
MKRGRSLTDSQCAACDMPLMAKGRTGRPACVVCPVLQRHRAGDDASAVPSDDGDEHRDADADARAGCAVRLDRTESRGAESAAWTDSVIGTALSLTDDGRQAGEGRDAGLCGREEPPAREEVGSDFTYSTFAESDYAAFARLGLGHGGRADPGAEEKGTRGRTPCAPPSTPEERQPEERPPEEHQLSDAVPCRDLVSPSPLTQEHLAAQHIVLNYVGGKHRRTSSHEEILARFRQGI